MSKIVKDETYNKINLKVSKLNLNQNDLLILKFNQQAADEHIQSMLAAYAEMLYHEYKKPICIIGTINGITDLISLSDADLKDIGMQRIPSKEMDLENKLQAPIQSKRFS